MYAIRSYYVRNIEKGTVIAKITKETEGEAGINVKNEKINPKPGKPAKVTFYENRNNFV